MAVVCLFNAAEYHSRMAPTLHHFQRAMATWANIFTVPSSLCWAVFPLRGAGKWSGVCACRENCSFEPNAPFLILLDTSRRRKSENITRINDGLIRDVRSLQLCPRCERLPSVFCYVSSIILWFHHLSTATETMVTVAVLVYMEIGWVSFAMKYFMEELHGLGFFVK